MTLIDTTIAAILTGVTPRTIRRWVHAGRLTNHGDPRHIRIDLHQLPEHHPCTSTPMSANV